MIECGPAQKPLYISPLSIKEGYSIKKVLSANNSTESKIKSKYPSAEIVDNTRSIMDDSSIDLVIVSRSSANDMGMVAEAIQAANRSGLF